MKYAQLSDARRIADELWDECKRGTLSKIGIDEIRAACGYQATHWNRDGWENYDWLVDKVLRLIIMKVG